jgi:toprim domain protein
MYLSDKVLIVEGNSDKHHVEEVLNEPVQIICTFGTMGVAKLDDILNQIAVNDIYVLTDADNEGRKIRQWFKRHLSESRHIYIDSRFGEVARCPKDYLAAVLYRQGFQVNSRYMKGQYYNERSSRDKRFIQSYSV